MFGQLQTESTLPIRKRRRPALSCVECRRRKIKCDRNHPCNHCKSSKIPVCTYKDVHTSVAERSVPADAVTKSSPRSERSGGSAHQIAPPNVVDYGYVSHGTYSDGPSSQTTPGTESSSACDKDGTSLCFRDMLGFGSGPTRGSTSISASEAAGHDTESLASFKDPKRCLPEGMKMNLSDEEREGNSLMGINFTTFNDVVVQDGIPQKAQLRIKYFHKGNDDGSKSKTRFFGGSNWMVALDQFRVIFSAFRSQSKITGDIERDRVNEEIRTLMEKCKTMTRKAKAERPIQWHTNPNFQDYVPSRILADQLVDHYLRTMEGAYRILHIPSFRQEYEDYWLDPQGTPTATIVKILLVMAIGTCFYQKPDHDAVRMAAKQWVYSAQSWVTAPFEKGRLNLSGLQVHCLLILARQTNVVGGDLLWIAAGSLLRTAFQMGFHRDPKTFPKISFLHQEIRRRLWATVLEMTVSTSLDVGMPPLITSDDFDTEPPANIDDEDIGETTTVKPVSKPPHVWTRASLQIQLLKSWGTRHNISKLVNGFKKDMTYDDVLRFDVEMTKACKEATFLTASYPPSLPHPTILQRIVLDLILRRFLTAVHVPFAAKSHQNPRYYYSRKVCVDSGLIILSHSGDDPAVLVPPGEMNDFTRLKTVGGGFYREVILHAGSLVMLELANLLEEELAQGLGLSVAGKLTRGPLQQAVRGLLTMTAKRIELGEQNVKGHIFLSAALAYVDALENNKDVEKGILEGALASARHCLGLLRARLDMPETPPFTEPPIENSGDGTMGVDQDFSYDFMMQDGGSSFNFEMPDAWLYSGWQEYRE
ncbi:hypothetical protein B0O99DRAFT_598148 [Bisporella sp. PMI_857]|nr:hypothetical protein B0O99DRAFT_598148 [Bisporella sp. PMI_857]